MYYVPTLNKNYILQYIKQTIFRLKKNSTFKKKAIFYEKIKPNSFLKMHSVFYVRKKYCVNKPPSEL